jgi:hypothetical protein
VTVARELAVAPGEMLLVGVGLPLLVADGE